VKFAGLQNKSLIFSILLMMVCVQSFSMHFHFEYEWNNYHSHSLAHSHTADMVGDHHAEHGYADTGESNILGALFKHLTSVDIALIALFLLVVIWPPIKLHWRVYQHVCSRRYYHFLSPPLRAPPA